MSKIIFIGIFFAFVSGFMLFLTKPIELLSTPKFLAKNLIFLILMVNGFVLHRCVLPKLIHFSFLKDMWIVKKIISLRQMGFITGAISAVSWYSVFLLGSFKNVPFSTDQLLASYLVILFGAIVVSLLIEKKITKSVQKNFVNKN